MLRPTLCVALSIATILAFTYSGVRAPSNFAQRTPPPRPDGTVQRSDDPLPEYIGGDECLFCHRFETGRSWQMNRHNQTVRPAGLDTPFLDTLRQRNNLTEFANSVQFVMGHTKRVRFLRKGQGYGRLELLNTEVVPAQSQSPAQVLRGDDPQWDVMRFGSSCAGCHTTQTDSRTQSFAAVSLDCYVCHGNATLDHTKDKTQMLFAQGHKEPARVVVSICGQCHVRGGHSNRTGLPYPNNFIAGADLFADFRVDLAAADDPRLNPGDRHVYHNTRSVIEHEKGDVTCLSCHSVHGQSTMKHRRLVASEICYICHDRGAARWTRPSYEVHSTVCGY